MLSKFPKTLFPLGRPTISHSGQINGTSEWVHILRSLYELWGVGIYSDSWKIDILNRSACGFIHRT